jgi:hypothetical protein
LQADALVNSKSPKAVVVYRSDIEFPFRLIATAPRDFQDAQ